LINKIYPWSYKVETAERSLVTAGKWEVANVATPEEVISSLIRGGMKNFEFYYKHNITEREKKFTVKNGKVADL